MAKRIGNYDVVAKLGGGALGSVFKATHIASGDTVALRILNTKLAGDAAYTEQFVAEARAAMRVEHQNVCKVRDVGQEGGAYFIATEFVEGVTLEDLLRKSGRLQADRATEYLRQASLALSAIHGFAMTHGRIKPSNIMVDRETTGIKLADFGVARQSASQLQQAELGLAGAPYYMAPELGKGLRPSIQCDLYSLGATLYHLVAGTPPFTGPHATAVLMKHAGEPAAPLSELDPSVPEALSSTIERLMAKEPGDRFDDPREMIKGLAGAGGKREVATGAKVRAVASPKKKKKTSTAAKRVTGSAPKGKKATGVSRGVGGVRKKSPVQAYAIAGGGLLVFLVLIVLLVFAREDPAITEIEHCITTARVLIDKRDPEGCEEASRMLREAVARLPNSAPAKHREKVARKVIEEAERLVFAATSSNVDRLVGSVRKAVMQPMEALTALDQIEARYELDGVPEMFRARMGQVLLVARTAITAAAEASAAETAVAEPAREATATDGIRDEVEALIRKGHYAEAVTIVDTILSVAESAAEKRAAAEMRAHVVKEAGVGFGLLARKIGQDADDERFADAKRRLKAVQHHYDFEPYRRRFELAFENLAAYMGEEAPARAPAPDPAPRPRQEPTTQPPPAPAPEPASEPPPAVADDGGTAEEAIVKAIDDAVSLVGDDKKAEASKLLNGVKAKYGSTQAYKDHKDEIDALILMASE